MLFMVVFENVQDNRDRKIVSSVLLSRSFEGSLIEVAEEATEELRSLGYRLIQAGKPKERTRVIFEPA